MTKMLHLSGTQEHSVVLGILFRKMQAEGLMQAAFYDGSVRTEEEFIAMMLRPGVFPLVLCDGSEFLALIWVQAMDYKVARGHFCFFRKCWGRKRIIPIGRSVYSYILHLRDADGYLFDVLIGITPERNASAWHRALDCGAQKVGVVPHFIFMADTGETENAVITAMTRNDLKMDSAQCSV